LKGNIMKYKISFFFLLIISSCVAHAMDERRLVPRGGGGAATVDAQNIVAGAVYWAESEPQQKVYFFNSRGDVVSDEHSSSHPLRLAPAERAKLNNRFDPGAEPAQPVKAKILHCIKRGRMLRFIDINGVDLGYCRYGGQLDIKDPEVGLSADQVEELKRGTPLSFRLDPMSVKTVTQMGGGLKAFIGWKVREGKLRYNFDGSKTES
jgi:hypothetical protein